jgi:thiol:disulfide interchange protein DsbC
MFRPFESSAFSTAQTFETTTGPNMNTRMLIWLVLIGCSTAPALSAGAEITDAVRKTIAQRLPGLTINSVSASPLPGVLEVSYDGGVIYVSRDARYAITGSLVDLDTRENLTDNVLAGQRIQILADVPENRMIIYEPADQVKHTITTFTDIDCPFCRKMHREMAEMNALGIRVRYMLFPRAGIPSASYEKAVSVWCAPDQRLAMSRAKAGEIPEKRACENPVAEHMALARRLGLTGTPFTITETGRVIAGYRPAQELLVSLDDDNVKATR